MARLPTLASPRLAPCPSSARPLSPVEKKTPVNLPMMSAAERMGGMTVLGDRTQLGWNNSSTHSAGAGKGRCHGGSQQCVPHGTASRGAALHPRPDPLFYFTLHRHKFMHFYLCKNKAEILTESSHRASRSIQ